MTRGLWSSALSALYLLGTPKERAGSIQLLLIIENVFPYGTKLEPHKVILQSVSQFRSPTVKRYYSPGDMWFCDIHNLKEGQCCVAPKNIFLILDAPSSPTLFSSRQTLRY